VRQDTLSPAYGATHSKKRVGRGNGSGHGTFATRGCKGAKSRSGGNDPRPGFEGGQLPLIKRLPQKRGFTNIYRVGFSVVNMDNLNAFEKGTEVTPEKLLAAGCINTLDKPVKVLADGEISVALTVKANKFSAAAKSKIEAAGGKAEEVEYASKTE
jgi:large subunit ribosomal protein L15